MKKLFASLEELEDQITDGEDEGGEKELNAKMIAMFEDEKDVAEIAGEMDEADEKNDEIQESVERLENIRDLIMQYGISKSMMLAADPMKELVTAGICKDYEELTEELDKGKDAEETAEAIGTALAVTTGTAAAKVGGAAIIGLSPIGWAAAAAATVAAGLMVVFGPSVVKALKSHKSGLQSAKKSLEAIADFDEEAFKEKSVSSYSKEEFKQAISAGEAVIKVVNGGALLRLADNLTSVMGSGISLDKINNISKKAGDILKGLGENKGVTEIVGLSVTAEGKVEGIKPTIKPQSVKLGEAGWSAGDAKEAIDATMALTIMAEGIEKDIKDTAATCKKVISDLKTRLKKDVEIPKEDKDAYKAAVNEIKSIIDGNKTMIKLAVSFVYKVNGCAINVAKAAIKSKQK